MKLSDQLLMGQRPTNRAAYSHRLLRKIRSLPLVENGSPGLNVRDVEFLTKLIENDADPFGGDTAGKAILDVNDLKAIGLEPSQDAGSNTSKDGKEKDEKASPEAPSGLDLFTPSVAITAPSATPSAEEDIPPSVIQASQEIVAPNETPEKPVGAPEEEANEDFINALKAVARAREARATVAREPAAEAPEEVAVESIKSQRGTLTESVDWKPEDAEVALFDPAGYSAFFHKIRAK